MTSDVSITLWTTEQMVSSLIVSGNTLDVSAAYKNFFEQLDVIDPLTMTIHMPSIKLNQIMRRWAGWLIWKQLTVTGEGNPACLNCNLSGSGLMFGVHNRGSRIVNMMLTPESVELVASYSRAVCATRGITSSIARSTSTKLKFQPSLATGTATSLTLFGNGSMQPCGSPKDIEGVCSVKAVMRSEPALFLETARRADVSVI
ncbi:hypothetical protein F4782DRAFT_470513 [Xylaria castorea]|nr:hypothetical protein F4782DRAFT_470513 [Xylaria castorea]